MAINTERRWVMVPVSHLLLIQMVEQGWNNRPPEGYATWDECIEGVPKDAEFIGAVVNPRLPWEVDLIFSHPSFEVADPNASLPVFTPVFVKHTEKIYAPAAVSSH